MIVNDKSFHTTNDAVAKYLFTAGDCSQLNVNFVNAVLRDSNLELISDFILKSPVFSPNSYDAKTFYLDVKGETSNYDQINYEIQRYNQEGLFDRLCCYNAKQYNNIPESTNYEEFPLCIVIAVVNFSPYIYPKPNVFHDVLGYRSFIDPRRCATSKPLIHILEIPVWNSLHKKKIKSKEDLKDYTELDLWMKFFSDATTYEELVIMSQASSDMHELKGKLDTFIQNEEYLKTYYKASEAERIHRAEISFARKEGKEDGVNQGKREMVQNMKRENIDISLIQKVSGWSKEDILSC